MVAYPLTDYDNLKEKLEGDILKPSTAATDALTLTTEALTGDNVSVTLDGDVDNRTEAEGEQPREGDGGLQADPGAEVIPGTEPPPSTGTYMLLCWDR